MKSAAWQSSGGGDLVPGPHEVLPSWQQPTAPPHTNLWPGTEENNSTYTTLQPHTEHQPAQPANMSISYYSSVPAIREQALSTELLIIRPSLFSVSFIICFTRPSPGQESQSIM